jgi:radical SAM protein with 4Fe4S-binding SPASM domain
LRRKPPGIAVRDLAWIDGFYRDMRPHLFAREEDGVVILPPNRVYKANSSGIAMLKHLERGGTIGTFPGLCDGERAGQVNGFFADLRDFCAGNNQNMDGRPSVEMIPFDFSYTSLPILGEIAVTYRCNNSCMFCYASCGSRPESREMTLMEIKRIIRIFKTDALLPFFSFTGGEPLLRQELEKMIEYAEHIGLRTNLVTNGTLADPGRAKSLYESGLRTAQVSVESPGEKLHDTLASRSGSWRETLSGMENLRAAGISVQTNTTITAVNAGSAPLMPAFLKSLGVRTFAMNLYIPGSAADNDRLFFSYSDIGRVIEQVRRAARAEGMTFYWYSPVPHCIYNPVAKGLGNKSCAAMDGLLSVSPAGDLLPCSSYPKPMGNLLRDGFRGIWFSRSARHFKTKEYAPAECAGCTSFTACQSACPLYWDRAGTREIRNPGSDIKEA